MAQVFGKKSEYLIKNDKKHYLVGFAIALSLFVLIYVYNISASNSNFQGFVIPMAIIFILSSLFLKSKSEKMLKISDRFFNGRFGEYDVCDELKKLPDLYSIFRNIKFENHGDIDLVVSGPSGVFTIEVKSHKGNIYFNSQTQKLEHNHKSFEKNFIGQAKAEALNLKTYLSQKTGMQSIFIDAVLVFSNEKAKLCFSSDVAANVQIVKKESLNNLIMGSNTKFTSEQLSLLNEKLLELV